MDDIKKLTITDEENKLFFEGYLQVQYSFANLERQYSELQNNYMRICSELTHTNPSKSTDNVDKDHKNEINYLKKNLQELRDHIDDITKLADNRETEYSKRDAEMEEALQNICELNKKIKGLENSLVEMVNKKLRLNKYCLVADQYSKKKSLEY